MKVKGATITITIYHQDHHGHPFHHNHDLRCHHHIWSKVLFATVLSFGRFLLILQLNIKKLRRGYKSKLCDLWFYHHGYVSLVFLLCARWGGSRSHFPVICNQSEEEIMFPRNLRTDGGGPMHVPTPPIAKGSNCFLGIFLFYTGAILSSATTTLFLRRKNTSSQS